MSVTYGELFNLFISRNKDIKRFINDYRPALGEYKIQIWLKSGYTFYARWIEEYKEFALSEVKF